MIEKYIEAMLNGDYKALAACFAPHCRYFDYCPIGTNRDNYHVYGREAIEMFFHHKFTFRILSITDPVIESETSANFLWPTAVPTFRLVPPSRRLQRTA